jgi:hypothetical protein
MEETAEALGLPSPADSVPEVGVYGALHVRASGIRESLRWIFRAACQPHRDICEPGLVRAIEHDLVAQLLGMLSGASEGRSRLRDRDRALKRCLEFIEQPARGYRQLFGELPSATLGRQSAWRSPAGVQEAV